MTKDEERAVLERAAKVAYEYAPRSGAAGAILSLPLESKETQEPVAWVRMRDGEIDWSEDCLYPDDSYHMDWPVEDESGISVVPLYLHPAECPKCDMERNSHEETLEQLEAAEAALAKCREETLEEAARVCERQPKATACNEYVRGVREAIANRAAAIRALKERK